MPLVLAFPWAQVFKLQRAVPEKQIYINSINSLSGSVVLGMVCEFVFCAVNSTGMIKRFAFLLLVLSFFWSCKQETDSVAVTQKVPFDQNAETESIMAVIENETSCFFARDYDCWKAHFAHVDYAFQAWNRADGTFDAKVGWPEIDSKAGQYIKDNPVPPQGSSHPDVQRRNVQVHFFNETLAYLSWDQYNFNPGTKAYTQSLETRIMEKMGQAWRIVNVTSYWDYARQISQDSLGKE